MKGTHCIYIHTFPNGKHYVGQTEGTCWKEYRRRFTTSKYKGCTLMYYAIKKYGWDNIHTDIVVEGLTQQEVNEMEIRYIAILRSTDDRYGYNISLGGGGKNLGKNCRSKDYRKEERNAWHRNKYNSSEEYRKFYNKRTNEYRKRTSRYKEYQKEYQRKHQKEYQRKKREKYHQSEEYQQKMKEKEQRRIEKANQPSYYTRKRIAWLESEEGKQVMKQREERHNRSIEYQKRIHYIDNRIQRAYRPETKQKWIKEKERVRSEYLNG